MQTLISIFKQLHGHFMQTDCKPLPPASSTRTAPILPVLRVMILFGAKSLPKPKPHPPSPAASPPLVKELRLGLGRLPCNAGATGIEMAHLLRSLPGDCPVKQSKTRRLLRLKKERGKKKFKRFLTDQHVSLATRGRYFDTVITPVAFFAAGHRAIFKNDFNNVDVLFRKLLRSVVGPPAATDWSRPWHEILHDWNARVAQFVQHCSVKCWSVRCVDTHWNLAQYAANLPPDLLMWTCRGHHTVGRPRNTSDTTLHLGNWRAVAGDANRWVNLTPQFVLFCTESWKRSSEGH